MKFRKAKLAQISFLLVLVLPSFAFALPEGENVVSGSASFDRSSANTLSVNTPSERLIVNYNSFSIAQPETVRFQQPSASAIVLNRVVGVDPSSIMGTLTANGRIFIVNPNGVLFGPNSHVDVAGLVASSLNISNEDFLNGNYVFSQSGKNGYVINQGTINASSGGFVCLLGGAVDNQLAIQADLGTVVLASGEKMTLALEDQNAISVVVDEAVQSEVFGPDGNKMNSAIKNSGSILAEGGKVILTAKVLNHVFDYSINNTGLVKVTSLVKHDNIIELMAEGAPIVNSGTLEAETVYIKVSNAGITNAPEGKIIAQVSPTALIGGKIFLEAASILQQGFISANVEQGPAGEISIISENNVVLDENSRTEARATGISGNGGKITINSKQGSVFVNKNAKIDFSAGSLAGNGGLFKVDAFAQLGFYGILNGRAPPGFTRGKAFLDPEYAAVSGSFLGDTDYTFDAWRDITIVGDILLGSNTTLNLFADQQAFTEDGEYFWYEWDTINPTIGAIINAGDFTVSGSGYSTLNLRAGSGIGSLNQKIQTNVQYLSAVINPDSYEGDIFIDQGNAALNIGTYIGEGANGIYSPGLVVLMSTGPIENNLPYDPAITADELYLEAEGGIYGYEESPFSISVNKLAVLNYGTGGINIVNDSYLVVLAAINYAVGQSPTESLAAPINISTSYGDIIVRYGILGNGSITLDAYNNIILSTLANIVTSQSSTVTLIAENGAIRREDLESEYGLRAYWNFDNDEDNYAYDASDNGNYAQIYGNPGITTGYFGDPAYSFDGIDDHMAVNGNFNLGDGSFTLICWYRGTQNLNNVGLMGASPYPYTSGYALETQYGALQYWVNNNMVRSAVSVNDGSNWYQLAMVRDGTEGRLSVFGEDVEYMVDFPVLEDSVNTSANFWIGGWGHTKRLAQGAINDVRVYDEALSSFEIYAQTLIAPGQGRINAGNVVLEAAGDIDAELGLSSTLNAFSETGDISIHGYGDLTLVPGYNSWAVFNSGGGDIEVSSDANITVQGQVTGTGDVNIRADGDLNVNNDMDGDTIYLWADADWDGIGALTIYAPAGDRVFYCYGFRVVGANSFNITTEGDYLSLDGYATYFAVRTPDESELRGLGVISTLEGSTLTVNSGLTFTDYINLSSAGDLMVYSNLSAQEIYLYADNNYSGSGQLRSYGQVQLTGKTHSFQSASGFNVYSVGEAGSIIPSIAVPGSLPGYADDFNALLADIDPADGTGLWYLSVLSTSASSGDIYVNAPLSQTAQISLSAGRDLYINAPITTRTGGIDLRATNGSIFGASLYNDEPFTHIATDVIISLYARGTIGPIDINVNVESPLIYGLNLSVYGAVNGISAVLTGDTPSGTIIVNNIPSLDYPWETPPPGQVLFNGGVVFDPATYVPPVVPEEPDDPYIPPDDPYNPPSDDHDHGSDLEPVELQAPVGSIISNQPVATNAADLGTFQFSSPMGTVFFYHSLSEIDMGAFDQLSIGADAYQLRDGQLQLIGHDSLQQFFQEFDQKRKQGSL